MPSSRVFCLVKFCYNYQPSPGSPAFFNLPSDPQRSVWVENAGRSDLREKNINNLSGKYYICADHFEPHCFIDPMKKTVLRRGSDVVPTIFKSNLTSLVNMDADKSFRDGTLAGTVMAEVESAQEILDTSVVSDDVLDSAEWTNIVAVSLGDDGSLMCDSLSSPSQDLSDGTVSLVADGIPVSDGMVMECLMLCRLCASLVQVSLLVPVFDENSDNPLREMIDRIIPGQVLLDDGLPQRVCTSCVARVRSCCEILDSFKTADARLRQMVELCNMDSENIARDGTLTLQENNDLPIILQSVAETTNQEMSNVSHSLGSEFSKGDASIQDCVTNSIKVDVDQMKQEESVPSLTITECVNMTDSINFGVHVSTDHISLEEFQQIECNICQQVFEEQTDLLSHFVNFHSTKLHDSVFTNHSVNVAFQCSICDGILSSDSCLRTHMISHVLGTIECSMCKMVFKDKNDLSDHIREEHGHPGIQKDTETGGNKCEHCEKEFKNATALRKHKATHTGERTVLCSLCGKTLANLNSLRVHLRIHSEDRPFTCAECGKSFKGPSELRSHSVTHTREKIYNCPECGRKFHSRGLVRQHMLSHTRDRPHKCDLCTASFNRLGNLNQHKKKHANSSVLAPVTPYECTLCGKRFQSKLTLKYHLAKHNGEKYPFDCEICGKKFIAIDPYRVHMRVHTGERPFECEVCKKTFRSSGTLKQHVTSLHRDDFPFACPFCQRSFKRLQSLIVHKKTHTGEKPWLCSQCGRAFAQKGDMIKHTKTHRPHIEEEEILMEVDTIEDLALDNEISKMIFG